MIWILSLIILPYVFTCGYYDYKSNQIVDKILNSNPNGYPYVNRIRGFNNQ